MKNGRKNIEVKSNLWALMPMGFFVILYFLALIVINNVPGVSEKISDVPIIPIFFIALIVALLQNKGTTMSNKAKTMGKGIGNSSIVSMLLIFVLAGIFTGTVGTSSAESVAYFLLGLFPPQFAVCVIFVVSCLVSLAMGTSVGAITVLAPIGCTVSTLSGQPAEICIASIIGGSMFGDNLSVISDTTIACTTGQGCKMQEKFIANAKIVVPAALATIVIIGFWTFDSSSGQPITGSYNLLEFIPYVIVLILGVLGINVFIVLGSGILSGILVAIFVKQTDLISIFHSMTTGAVSMSELIVVTIIVAAMSALIEANGGFAAILKVVRIKCRNQYSAQVSIGVLVMFMDVLTANNTVAIVVANPIAKKIGRMYSIKRRRIASILDTCSCAVQGILPYGAQVLIALSVAESNGIHLASADVIPCCVYQYLLFVAVAATILIGYFTKSHVKTDSNYS